MYNWRWRKWDWNHLKPKQWLASHGQQQCIRTKNQRNQNELYNERDRTIHNYSKSNKESEIHRCKLWWKNIIENFSKQGHYPIWDRIKWDVAHSLDRGLLWEHWWNGMSSGSLSYRQYAQLCVNFIKQAIRSERGEKCFCTSYRYVENSLPNFIMGSLTIKNEQQ